MRLEEEVDPGHPDQRNVHYERFFFGPTADPWCGEEHMVGSGERRGGEAGGGVSSRELGWVALLAHRLTLVSA